MLLSQGEENDRCLTEAQVQAVRKIYAGPKNPRTGEQIVPGYEPGSEGPAGDPLGGWETSITGVLEPMRLDFWRYWIFDDPGWDWRTFDFDRDLTYADTKLASVNATNPDLSRFKALNGKIIVYQGWADPVSPPEAAITYYENVTRTMGGPEATRSFFRLFMVTGMSHCSGGAGVAISANNRDPERDVLSALDRWVESGIPPDQIISAHASNGVEDRTRPVCPYPQVARWNGTGSKYDARNFACKP